MLTGTAHRMKKDCPQRMRVILPWLIGLAFVAVEIQRVSGQITVRYPDFFGWAKRAARFDLSHPWQWDWVRGLYPCGYPLLLRLGVGLGLDVLQAAFVISILGGFLGLMGTFWLVRRLSNNWTLAVLSQAFLACLSFYLYYSSIDSTDALAAGLQLCSLALLLSDTSRRRVAFGAGVLAGLSYLIRYTASLTILLSALFLLGLALARRQREGVVSVTVYMLGAGIGAAPQLIASLLIKGTLFYNYQAHNLWFHLLHTDDYIRKWHSVPMDISLWEVISADPARFFSHWWKTFRSAWDTGDAVAVDPPLGPLTRAGFLFAVLGPGLLRRSARGFIALYVVGLIALLSFTRLDRRFLITILPLEVFGCLHLLWTLLPGKVRIRRFMMPLRLPILLIALVIRVRYPIGFMRSNPVDEQVIEVSNIVHAAGAQSAFEVFSTHVGYHDVADPWKRRFMPAVEWARDLDSDELMDFIHAGGYRLFIFDKQTGVFMFPEMEGLLYPVSRPAGLAPVYVHDKRDFVIYRVEGADWPAPSPVGASFEGDIVLSGYELYQSDDAPPGSGRRIGLYLHWEPAQPVGQWLKIFVHVMDGDGQLVAQHDSVPALWTYPTNEWAEGESILDFHSMSFDAALGPGPYTILVGLYDGGTGQRILILDSSGTPGDDAVVLETFTFD
jgi:hypothetical protein